MPRTKPNHSELFKREVPAYQTSTSISTKQPACASETPEAELKRLRRENHELQRRCVILKKR